MHGNGDSTTPLKASRPFRRGRRTGTCGLGGPRPFAVESLAQRFLSNVRAGATTSPQDLLRASSNVSTRYGIAPGLGLSADDINRRVRRIPADMTLRGPSGPYVELQPFDGRLTRPLLSLQGTGDLQVPIAQQQAWRRSAVAAGTHHLLVQRVMRIPGHCAFTLQEEVRAFDDLANWVRAGVRPAGDDVMGDLRNAGRLFTDPLRPCGPGGVGLH